MELYEFLPSYPSVKDLNFAKKITSKREFRELADRDDVRHAEQYLFNHQELIRRFFTEETPYNAGLLFHEVGVGKCVMPETKVLLNGKYISIERIWNEYKTSEINFDGIGYWVKPYCNLNVRSVNAQMNLVTNKIMNIYKQRIRETIRQIELENNDKIEITMSHLLFTEKGWQKDFRYVNYVCVCKDNDVEFRRIRKVTEKEYEGYVYDLQIENDHNYVANGIICHNTCSAIAVCEMNMIDVHKKLKYQESEYDSTEMINDHRALIIVKGDTIKNNFIRDLEQTCAKGLYNRNKQKQYTDQGKRIAFSRKINESYEIKNIEAFSKELVVMTGETIQQKYSGRVIVIDEAHTLRTLVEPCIKDEDGVTSFTSKFSYNQIHRLLHLVKNCKVLLLTATPMVDNVQEIASIMNLILDESEAIDPNVLLEKDDIRLMEYLRPKFNGRVSYVRQSESTARCIDMGEPMEFILPNKTIKRTHMKIVKHEMSDFQYNVYAQADNDSENKNHPFCSKKRNASNFVFPDKTFGKEGYEKNVTESDTQDNILMKTTFRFKNNELFKRLQDSQYLKLFSCKFANIIEEVKKSSDECCFCYTSLVRGSGANLLSLCFYAQGFEPFLGQTSEIQKSGRRYALITNFTTEKMINNILTVFNAPKNATGNYLKVLIGSPKSGEGLNFKHVRQVHIVEPFWHNSATYQAIGRAFRADSHTAFPKEGKYVKVYRHAAMYRDQMTVDIEMYNSSEEKDRHIKRIERIMKRCSFDCLINRSKNIRTTDIDDSIEADYQNKDYTCIGCEDNTDIPEDLSTYHLYYAEDLFKEIQTKVSEIFRNQFIISLKELFEILSVNSYHEQTILLSLDKMIREQVQVTDRFGFLRYIKESDNIVYLQNTLGDNDLLLTEYTHQIIVQNSVSFTEYMNNMDVEKAKDFLNKIKDYTYDKFTELWKLLNIEVKIHILEQSLNHLSHIDPNKRSWIIKQLETNIFIFEQHDAIIHILYQISFDRVHYNVNSSTLKQKGKLRILSKKDEFPKWRYVTEDEDQYFLPLINNIIIQKEQEISNKYSIYGIWNSADSEFRLRDKDKESKMKRTRKDGSKDGRTHYPGSICKNISKTQLIKYIEMFEIKPPITDNNMTDKKRISELQRSNLQLNYEDMSNDEFRFYYEWNKYNRDELSHYLFSYFLETGRLLIK